MPLPPTPSHLTGQVSQPHGQLRPLIHLMPNQMGPHTSAQTGAKPQWRNIIVSAPHQGGRAGPGGNPGGPRRPDGASSNTQCRFLLWGARANLPEIKCAPCEEPSSTLGTDLPQHCHCMHALNAPATPMRLRATHCPHSPGRTHRRSFTPPLRTAHYISPDDSCTLRQNAEPGTHVRLACRPTRVADSSYWGSAP